MKPVPQMRWTQKRIPLLRSSPRSRLSHGLRFGDVPPEWWLVSFTELFPTAMRRGWLVSWPNRACQQAIRSVGRESAECKPLSSAASGHACGGAASREETISLSQRIPHSRPFRNDCLPCGRFPRASTGNGIKESTAASKQRGVSRIVTAIVELPQSPVRFGRHRNVA